MIHTILLSNSSIQSTEVRDKRQNDRTMRLKIWVHAREGVYLIEPRRTACFRSSSQARRQWDLTLDLLKIIPSRVGIETSSARAVVDSVRELGLGRWRARGIVSDGGDRGSCCVGGEKG